MVRKRSEVRILLTAPQNEFDEKYQGWGHPISFNHAFIRRGRGDVINAELISSNIFAQLAEAHLRNVIFDKLNEDLNEDQIDFIYRNYTGNLLR